MLDALALCSFFKNRCNHVDTTKSLYLKLVIKQQF